MHIAVDIMRGYVEIYIVYAYTDDVEADVMTDAIPCVTKRTYVGAFPLCVKLK